MRQTPGMRIVGDRRVAWACIVGMLALTGAPCAAGGASPDGPHAVSGGPGAPMRSRAVAPVSSDEPDDPEKAAEPKKTGGSGQGAEEDEDEDGNGAEPEEADPFTGSWDAEETAGCRAAGSVMTEDSRFLITTITNLWEIAVDGDRWTLTRRIERNGVPDIIREGTANVEWRRWEASEEIRCLCASPRVEGESHCRCSIQTTSSAHTVTVVGTDTVYPESDSTRSAEGQLKLLPDGRLQLRIGDLRCVLRKL